MKFAELDYFDCLRLDGKRARLLKSDGSAEITCEGMRFDLNVEGMLGADLDAKTARELTPEKLKAISVPLPNTLDLRGGFKLVNMNDEVWMFAFIAPPDFVYIIKGNTFAKTLEPSA